MTLKEIKAILSSYNRLELRVYDGVEVKKDIQIDNIKHLNEDYDNYHITKIETLKSNVLTIRLENI